jgi:hypothetical protein
MTITTINQLVSGIQQASITGATHIPQSNNNNFIEEEDVEENNFRENIHKAKSYLCMFENTYNELQMSVLLAMVYFITITICSNFIF